ncbi:hypothetical protein Y1Q_0019771 [Alligator mississippiensis]|uniref:Uncharacterized protein n=1 Tax=Alligator mississippiensis TaxID=8496 RepID=A0A151PFH2_ALLMI|nr:hypothetical protein Y1Q_0019771 [Alligator mississippiensis]
MQPFPFCSGILSSLGTMGGDSHFEGQHGFMDFSTVTLAAALDWDLRMYNKQLARERNRRRRIRASPRAV